jgi:hypothetical protein
MFNILHHTVLLLPYEHVKLQHTITNYKKNKQELVFWVLASCLTEIFKHHYELINEYKD